MTEICKIARAIISVSDKTGLIDLAKWLDSCGVELLSTGGSAEKLRQNKIKVTEVSDYTGFPEIMDGRVKTLHPKIHGGLLQRRDSEKHHVDATKNNILPIDLVIVNLYPFQSTVNSGADFDACIENIDIGGPAMIRAAAKNHDFVAIITSPSQYEELIAEMKANNGGTTLAYRKKLAAAAYAHTAAYDSAISSWFSEQLGEEYSETLTFSAKLRQSLRYGENPHQSAAFYVTGEKRPCVANAIQIQGKELSYNNISDADAAFNLVSEFSNLPAVAIIKHANPCGVAVGPDLLSAYKRAFACDPISAFGGIIACNRPLDGLIAEAISSVFSEVIIAPDIDDNARKVLSTKKNLRVMLTRTMPNSPDYGKYIKSVSGGYLVQSRDNLTIDPSKLVCVTKRQPTTQEMNDLIFAFTVAKHVKSNAIVYAKDGATVGIGAGQMSRVDSAQIAAQKAKEAAQKAGLEWSLTYDYVAASDAFFPFPDGLTAIIKAGAKAVIQPGGSVRDQEIIQVADEAGIAMVFTGIRHFYH